MPLFWAVQHHAAAVPGLLLQKRFQRCLMRCEDTVKVGVAS